MLSISVPSRSQSSTLGSASCTSAGRRATPIDRGEVTEAPVASNGTVDMGCQEEQPLIQILDGWLTS